MSYGWNGNTSQVLRKEPVSMAEPVHRIPPAGASSAQSMRNIPKSNVQQVKDICLYYVQKCSGKYQNNKAAARYIHQMAEEIILQLAGVAHEIKMNRGEPEQFQTLLEEWNEHFPPSLGALGSPKAIAILIANQSREIQKLKDELDVEKLKRENDVSTILRSMDSQLHSYRSSVMNDRRQQRVLFDQEIHNFEEHVKEMKKNFEEEKKTMNNTYNKEFTKLEMHYEGLLKESQQNLEKTLAQHEKDMTKMKQRKDDKIKFLKDRMKELKTKLSTMKQKYNVLAVILNEDTESTSEEDDQDLDENISVLIETDSDISDTESLLNIDLEKRKVEKEERKKKRAEEREEKIANMKLDLIPKLDQQSTTSNNNNGGLNIDLTAELKQLKEVNFAALANIRKLEAVKSLPPYSIIFLFFNFIGKCDRNLIIPKRRKDCWPMRSRNCERRWMN